MKYTFMILLGVHILGDFYFQSEKMARRKESCFAGVIIHLGEYAVVSGIIMYILMPSLPMNAAAMFIISHGLIDFLKYVICNSCKAAKKGLKNRKNIFIVDQMTHIWIILWITYLLRGYPVDYLYNAHIRVFFDAFTVSETQVISWGMKFLVLHKPANILIASILEEYKPEDKKSQEQNEKNVGRFIGTLERFIMAIFITIKQYSAVGLVLTAKSIARYDKIAKEPLFAEYYLLGTLLSTLCAVCISVLF